MTLSTTGDGPALWPPGFDPTRLTRHATLNGTVIKRLEGPLRRFGGRTGGELLGRDAVRDLLAAAVHEDVGHAVVTDTVLRHLGGGAAPAVTAVLDEVGDRLAALIATLRDPATGRDAPPPRQRYLAAWRVVRSVTLAGGLAAGAAGGLVASRASASLAAAGVDLPVHPSPHAPWLALLGAARSGPPGSDRRLVLDGGQTSIKRAVVTCRGSAVTAVRLLPVVSLDRLREQTLEAVVAEAIEEADQEVAGSGAPVVMSLAAYVAGNRPIVDGASVYEDLAARADAIERRVGRTLRFVHDGTAAWRGAATAHPSAVIAMGTWLGVGLGPQRHPLLERAPGLSVR